LDTGLVTAVDDANDDVCPVFDCALFIVGFFFLAGMEIDRVHPDPPRVYFHYTHISVDVKTVAFKVLPDPNEIVLGG
jgi:hypothetical protein